ncbi:MAG: protein-disulfide reductase DsbD domain-containing protein [Alphaproteobacteria bacterium]
MAAQNPIGAGRIWLWGLVAVFAIAVAWPNAQSQAQSPAASQWSRNDHAQVRLVSATTAVGTLTSLRLGLQFRLAPKWKIYWRSPGDAGYPPVIEWAGSTNLAAATPSWPAPKRYSIFGLNTFVYTGEVVLPITLEPRTAGRPIHVKALVRYLLCDEICIPYQAKLSLKLPLGPAAPSGFTVLIDRFQARVPGKGPGPVQGLTIIRAQMNGGKDGPVLEVLARSELPFSAPDLLVEGPRQLTFGAPKVQLSGQGRTALLRLPVAITGEAALAPTSPRLTLTLIDGDRAMEQSVTAVPGVAEAVPFAPLLTILALALLGGLILNLMPCVLPVLSLKLLSVIGHGGGDRRDLRLGFLATAAGILFSFLVLAVVAVGLKNFGGMAVGWGIQFQQPVFLVAMSLVLVFFACNLWGFFQIRLPDWVGRVIARDSTVEDHHHEAGRRLGGAFATGAFATLLATPCSAPFLGTAVGFALARGPMEIIAVFAALGTGLALPYLAVAAFPGIARHLPRPGPWMDIVRMVLGFALAGTAGWLISVLVAQSGGVAAAAVAALMLASVGVLWGHHRLAPGTGRAHVGAAMVLGAFAVLAFAAPAALAPSWTPQATNPGDKMWRPFDKVAILNHVGAGKTVFVDVTADWCVSCQVNKALVLDRGAVARRFKAPDVVAMRADWTRPNREIAEYLAGFGRYGIPFNVVYGPRAPSGIVLSELLTTEGVLAALDRAGAKAGPAKPSKSLGTVLKTLP